MSTFVPELTIDERDRSSSAVAGIKSSCQARCNLRGSPFRPVGTCLRPLLRACELTDELTSTAIAHVRSMSLSHCGQLDRIKFTRYRALNSTPESSQCPLGRVGRGPSSGLSMSTSGRDRGRSEPRRGSTHEHGRVGRLLCALEDKALERYRSCWCGDKQMADTRAGEVDGAACMETDERTCQLDGLEQLQSSRTTSQSSSGRSDADKRVSVEDMLTIILANRTLRPWSASA